MEYPTADEVQAAGVPQLRVWFERLPTPATPEQVAVMQHVVQRLLDFDQFHEHHRGRMQEFVRSGTGLVK